MMNNYEPVMAVGSTYHKLGKMKNAANAFGPWDPDEFTVEDSAFGFVTFKNGATVILESSWALNTLQIGEAMTVLCGTKAEPTCLTAGSTARARPLYTRGGSQRRRVAFYEVSVGRHTPARMWIGAILNDTDVYVKPEEALVVTEILEAIYRSAESGKPYYF